MKSENVPVITKTHHFQGKNHSFLSNNHQFIFKNHHFQGKNETVADIGCGPKATIGRPHPPADVRLTTGRRLTNPPLEIQSSSF